MNPDEDPSISTRPASPARAAAILNVNDDDANRFALTRILQSRGFRVEEARTGAEALRLVAEARPDLVVLDVELPDIDGFEVCRRIKADPATAAIPVLHLSAQYVLEEDRTHGLVSGADGYLIQPVEPLELIASIRGLLRMRQGRGRRAGERPRVEQLERELQALERLADAPPPAAARGPQFRPLREVHPDAFRELVGPLRAPSGPGTPAAEVQGRARLSAAPPGDRRPPGGPRRRPPRRHRDLRHRPEVAIRRRPRRQGAGLPRRGPAARPGAHGPPGLLLPRPAASEGGPRS